MDFQVESMSCAHCVKAITGAVQAIDPAARVEIDLSAQRVHVESARPREAVVEAIEAAGYPIS